MITKTLINTLDQATQQIKPKLRKGRMKEQQVARFGP